MKHERTVVDAISDLLSRPADEVDEEFGDSSELVAGVADLNACALVEEDGLSRQQLLLSRLYGLSLVVPTDRDTAEGSVVLHRVTRQLEKAVAAFEDAHVDPAVLDSAPDDPRAYLSWLKRLAREHRVFKHPYYTEFIRDRADAADMRRYMIQESVIDGRFDDLLALMQVGIYGEAKMEIARNYWDEMGNGSPEDVHTTLFEKIYEVFDIRPDEMEASLTGTAMLTGNLAVMLSRYRRYYPEAVGYLGMTEWLVPDRFVNVVHAWERLGLPDVGIKYHRLHITIDSKHAAGWFHNIVLPAAESPSMRRGITRGTLWRLNSSARYLDERLAESVGAPA